MLEEKKEEYQEILTLVNNIKNGHVVASPTVQNIVGDKTNKFKRKSMEPVVDEQKCEKQERGSSNKKIKPAMKPKLQ